MVRPVIRRKNLYRRYLAAAKSLAREWTRRYKGIEAIMLTGGVARAYADERSDVDLTLFLNPATYRSWVHLGQSPLTAGDNLLGGIDVDTHLTTIPLERERPWEPMKIWDASSARVLLDRRGRLAHLLKTKVMPPVTRWRLHEEAVWVDWFVELGVGWIDRTDVVAAHHLLNRALDHFLSLLFEAQNEHLPFDKWQVHLSRTLRILPRSYERYVREWLSIRSFTARDVRRRAHAASVLSNWWKETFRDVWLGSKTHDAIVALRGGPIPLRSFQERFGADEVIRLPLRAVIRITRERGRSIVHLDSEALARALRESVPGMLEYQREWIRLAAGP